jgi:hypothetical protein
MPIVAVASLPRVRVHLELHWLLCLPLDDRDPLSDRVPDNEIGHAERDEVATAQLAVDGQIEQREIAEITGELKTRPDRPDLLRLKRPLLTDEPALVARRFLGPDRWELDSWHEVASIRPSQPKRRHRAGASILPSSRMTALRKAAERQVLRRGLAAGSPN